MIFAAMRVLRAPGAAGNKGQHWGVAAIYLLGCCHCSLPQECISIMQACSLCLQPPSQQLRHPCCVPRAQLQAAPCHTQLARPPLHLLSKPLLTSPLYCSRWCGHALVGPGLQCGTCRYNIKHLTHIRTHLYTYSTRLSSDMHAADNSQRRCAEGLTSFSNMIPAEATSN